MIKCSMDRFSLNRRFSDSTYFSYLIIYSVVIVYDGFYLLAEIVGYVLPPCEYDSNVKQTVEKETKQEA